MNLRQVRIDDRLIHGQVVVGCCGPLGVRRLILCNDEVAADELHSQIYESAVPSEIAVLILNLADCLNYLQTSDDVPAMLVVGSPADVRWLVDNDFAPRQVVVGGLHYGPGRNVEMWPGVFVGDRDREDLTAMMERGVGVVVQAVPAMGAIDAGPALKDAG